MAKRRLHGAVTARRIIAVPERGHTDLSARDWAKLEDSSQLRRLIDSGVVSATILPGAGVRLSGSCYVGRAQCGEFVIELREKVDGALGSLIAHATHDAFRVEKTDAPASELGDLAALIVHQFLDAVTAYSSRGRHFRYSVERRIGSLVGGRLDVTRSIQLRARGLGHMLAFDKNAITHRTLLNRVVLAALREVEFLKGLVTVPASDVARARGLAMLFADCRDAEILFGRRSAFAEQARGLLGSRLASHDRDMVALASVVLSHESFEQSAPEVAGVPRAWFLNLETLFEEATRSVLRSALQPDFHVTRGGEHGRRVFEAVAGEYAAYPDVAIGGAGGFEAIGDVKYKEWTGSASASDVYQLLVHASTFGCENAFLVYPSDHFEVRELGDASTGCAVTLFAVDVRDLESGLASLASRLNLVAPSHVEGRAGAGAGVVTS